MSRTYPYVAWVIQPSGKPKAVEIVGRAYSYSYEEYDKVASGKVYLYSDLHPTKEAAINAALDHLVLQEGKLAKMAEKISKKRKVLEQARAAA